MRYLFVSVALVAIVTVISVYTEAHEDAARVAPKTQGRVPASSVDPVPEGAEEGVAIPPELEGSSIEVGFSQDGEPEPHLLAVVGGGKVRLFQLVETSQQEDQVVARHPTVVGQELRSKPMPAEHFLKRLHQAVEEDLFFEARQPRRKSFCHDRYVLRVKQGDRFRERRGCTNQSSDAFAAFAQLFFRDAFIVWSRAEHDSRGTE